jgi:hypothetical protein
MLNIGKKQLMTKDKVVNELEDLCKRKRDFSLKCYWSVELYGKGHQIRKFAFYPQFLPILAYSNHSGPFLNEKIEEHDYKNDAQIYLTFQSKIKNVIEEKSSKRAFVITHPNVFFRRKKKIIQDKNAKGTVFFPVHSIPGTLYPFDIDEYCNKIKSLSKEFYPIKVCLHMHDINKKVHLNYLANNVDVVTAGNTSNKEFIPNLYEIIRKAKYTSSNMIGTSSLLSIEMGVPFFLFDKIQIRKRSLNNKYVENIWNEVFKSKLYKKIESKVLFNEGKIVKIDSELKNLVRKNLGVYDSISRLKLSKVLWLQFFKELLLFTIFKKLFKYYFKK